MCICMHVSQYTLQKCNYISVYIEILNVIVPANSVIKKPRSATSKVFATQKKEAIQLNINYTH